jgi:hypothetical protein
MLIECETVPGDWGSWRLYLYDPAARKAEPLDIRTHGGSRSFSNPGVEIVTVNGHQSLLLTMFLFTDGAATGEDGGLPYYGELPED